MRGVASCVDAVAADWAARVPPALQALVVEAVVADLLQSRTGRHQVATQALRHSSAKNGCLQQRTVVTTPLICSSRRSRQTGQVGSSVCPTGGSGGALLLETATSFTKTRRQTTSGSKDENWAHNTRSARALSQTPEPQKRAPAGAPACC